MVDTGASLVVVSDRLGKLLRVSGNKNLPTMQASTAGGTVESPLFILKSIKIGSASEFGVEATTNPHFKDTKEDGLLGMSFLGNFKVEIDQTNNKMFLKPIVARGEMLWGGHNEAWWRNRYQTYVKKMRQYRNYVENYLMEPKKLFNFRKMITHYSKLHQALDKRADQVGLPKKFRVYP